MKKGKENCGTELVKPKEGFLSFLKIKDKRTPILNTCNIVIKCLMYIDILCVSLNKPLQGGVLLAEDYADLENR